MVRFGGQAFQRVGSPRNASVNRLLSSGTGSVFKVRMNRHLVFQKICLVIPSAICFDRRGRIHFGVFKGLVGFSPACAGCDTGFSFGFSQVWLGFSSPVGDLDIGFNWFFKELVSASQDLDLVFLDIGFYLFP
jgi:hypothetical protein